MGIRLIRGCVLLGSCFLVNYVTSNGKTNFAEGVTSITFYAMIVSVPMPLHGKRVLTADFF
ncbi:uncharacterized protein TRAVEDRAFT_135009 [Trametes versicolor FP-101664 SS1]|uniref:uncharacterized protein n=1 Tax=Trametes versicolor (strain FP-101664) TaxID=717944 RepID=UPI00046231AC|nr:uncharacterized protein TRAVEDRAFT_135009 [Trametes versicolor FP-101664 SS1]EIW52997.1 hypothetical protein TRAVEDRAFT_135009 [Trametes versicolor FP-101664 SS1]